jgi:uncharacterized protein (TIGR02246 family)
MDHPIMEPTSRAFRFKSWLIFLSVVLGLVLLVAFYRQGNLTRESLTKTQETRQPEAPAPTDGGPTTHQDSDHESAVKQPERREATTREVRTEPPDQTVSKLARAWNQGKSQEIAALFTPDGILTIPDGSKFQSRPEIGKTITEKQSGILSETRLSNTVDEVSEIDANTTVVKGRFQLDGLKILGFNKAANGTFVLRQLKKDGKWLISDAEVRTGGEG